MFERGNPYRYTDPSGHSFGEAILDIIAAMAADSTLEAATSDTETTDEANEAQNAVMEAGVGGAISEGTEHTLTKVAGKVVGKLGGLFVGFLMEMPVAGGPACGIDIDCSLPDAPPGVPSLPTVPQTPGANNIITSTTTKIPNPFVDVQAGKTYDLVDKRTKRHIGHGFSSRDISRLNSGGIVVKGDTSHSITTIGGKKKLLTVRTVG